MPTRRSPEGETALMTAARSGNVAAVKVLLAHGADVNAREAWKGQTALMWAAVENHAAVARAADRGGRRRQGAIEGRRVHAVSFCRARRSYRCGPRTARRRRRRERDAARRHQRADPGGHECALRAGGDAAREGADPTPPLRGGRRCTRLPGRAGRTTATTCPAPVPTGSLDALDLVRTL